MKETNSPGFGRWSVGNRGDIEKERQDSPPKTKKKDPLIGLSCREIRLSGKGMGLNCVRKRSENKKKDQRRFCTKEEGGVGGVSLQRRSRKKSDNYAIRKKSSTEGKPVTSKWRGKISRDSYLIPFQWLDQ